ncbi:DnaA N-terminal domain-containing protein [Mameliella alba]|uniref:Replication initiator protein DnaA n=1 Tax=Mameliella alba TaxID=561184 RepID=A0A0B3RTJ3_9RHOB|nr:DnaA N-terminal domain-containing protein [Mameliella alba]KHQ50083.1 Replication initiator protein DnaA [Mameliella alba]
MTLVTARYNWARDELTVGQREMARLWSVDERTVKREIKRLTAASILLQLQLRPGVRGRVAAYRLNIAEIPRLGAPVWDRVGPDYSDRMARQTATPSASEKVVRVDFKGKGARTEATKRETPASGDPWARTQAWLAELEPSLHRRWFSPMTLAGYEGGVLALRAPSRFLAQYVQTHHQRLLRGAAQLEFPGLRRIEIGV